MVNLLLFSAIAQASDVYEICRHEKQIWSDRQQQFETDYVSTFYSRVPLQLIIHENLFEINRDRREIKNKFETNDQKCWREHANSTLCYNESLKKFEWDFYSYNGKVTRDVMSVCFINGEPI